MALPHSPLRLFLASRLLAALALQSFQVGLGWHVYQLTGRPLDLGLLGLCQFMPNLLLMPVVGRLIDRVDRLRALRLCQQTSAAVLALMAALTFGHAIGRDVMLVLIFVYGCARAFEAPSQQAALPALAGSAGLLRAVAAASSVQKIGSISGTLLGGLLCALDPGLVYAVGALLFLSSSTLLGVLGRGLGRTLRGDGGCASPSPPASGWSEIFAGLEFLRRQPVLLGAMTLDMMATLFGGVLALLPMIARDVLHMGPAGLGMLRAASACGGLGMGLLLARWPLRDRVGSILFGSVGAYGLATIAFGLSHVAWLSALLLAVIGAADMVSTVIRNSLVQLDTPDAMRGRVGAVNFTFVSASGQLGQLESGLAASWFGGVPAVLIGGAGALLVTALWLRGFPGLWRRRTLARQ